MEAASNGDGGALEETKVESATVADIMEMESSGDGGLPKEKKVLTAAANGAFAATSESPTSALVTDGTAGTTTLAGSADRSPEPAGDLSKVRPSSWR